MKLTFPLLALLLLSAVGVDAQSRAGRRPPATYPVDVQTGEAELQVGRSQLVHRVAIAPNAVVAVEFPADDAVVSEHPGNRDLVALDGTGENETATSARRPTDPLIFRPGPGFTLAAPGKPLTLYGVQFGSGLYVTFLFYPTPDLARNAHRLVLKYGLDEMTAARQKAGLRTNLIADLKPRIVKEAERLQRTEKDAATVVVAKRQDAGAPPSPPEDEPVAKSATSASDITPPAKNPDADAPKTPPPGDESVGEAGTGAGDITPTATAKRQDAGAPPSPPGDESVGEAGTGAGDIGTPVTAKRQDAGARPSPPGDESVAKSATSASDITPTATAKKPDAGAPPSPPGDEPLADRLRRLAQARIARLRDGSEKLAFGKPRYGLTLAVAENADLDDRFRIVVVAVKNRLPVPLRLTPGQPDLFIETLQKGRPVISERLIPFVTVSTAADRPFLPPEDIRWFALVYPAPILGVSQTLKVAVSQTNAADAPTAVEITVKGR
jgi:hypothetical protein